MNKEDLTLIETKPQEEEQKQENQNSAAIELSFEQLQEFYEQNPEAVELLGGLDIFESLLNVPDEQFETLVPSFLQIFTEVLNEKEAKNEILAILNSSEYDEYKLQQDFALMSEAIDEIDFLK